MKISNLTLGIVSTNTYFIENDTELILIDPSSESKKILNRIQQSQKQLKAILLTHAHFDHIAALDDVLKQYDVPVYMHPEEFDFLSEPEKNGSVQFQAYGLPIITSHANPTAIEEGHHQIGQFQFDALHTPGHSPGSLTYVFDEFAVVGDTLFNNGIGRTDLYRGDYETLVDSIQDKIFNLDETLPLYPGHGPFTTVENEYMNPYLHG
ncbi:MBL fold metallo-hydrolase [Staphylococcus coagulans]|uniref:MBL fold metallo-hydrolase n=1 Tax=Staphylococcus coagulans TaxID=74706 RepID=A0ABU1EVZ4_9STAP|nr:MULTISPECIES: MBL fold metallo-hydrolase [Staphylococcus]NHA36020.1 hydroxyacylglutathione hydrolase [Staphylococcus schleiferi]MBT2829435.1 MBL fold metallo-hydrolase [Staphylococcus coagulans]MBT2858909.1 MBL fold metallo-hydrolase [Staphylococcus coagulans]MBU3872087.1 MBL fold metallo-hydrolase [Staphylococcus coagulans]MDR5602292.1 MBL fold metallo-hydrolase [Staphylococcus coagulans]